MLVFASPFRSIGRRLCGYTSCATSYIRTLSLGRTKTALYLSQSPMIIIEAKTVISPINASFPSIPMAPIPQNTGTPQSSDDTLKLETATVPNDGSRENLSLQSEALTPTPATPEVLHFQRDRQILRKVSTRTCATSQSNMIEHMFFCSPGKTISTSSKSRMRCGKNILNSRMH